MSTEFDTLSLCESRVLCAATAEPGPRLSSQLAAACSHWVTGTLLVASDSLGLLATSAAGHRLKHDHSLPDAACKACTRN